MRPAYEWTCTRCGLRLAARGRFAVRNWRAHARACARTWREAQAAAELAWRERLALARAVGEGIAGGR